MSVLFSGQAGILPFDILPNATYFQSKCARFSVSSIFPQKHLFFSLFFCQITFCNTVSILPYPCSRLAIGILL